VNALRRESGSFPHERGSTTASRLGALLHALAFTLVACASSHEPTPRRSSEVELASAPTSALSSVAVVSIAPARAVEHAVAASLPIPRAEYFGQEPEVRAACPADMTLVDGAFCPRVAYACLRRVDQKTTRCAEYARGYRCIDEPDPRRFCIDRHEWPNRVGENPQVYVDWHEAKALCSAAGKRLCRRSEWILACEGPKRLPYPWGFTRQPSPCNIDRTPIPHDAAALGAEPTRELELPRLWQADPIGTHPDCVSSFGAYDLSGNVDEWTDDRADNAASDHPSTLNGGYWGPVRDTCRLTTKTHGPTFKFYQVGFRCCGDTLDGVVLPPPRPWVERDNRRDPAAEVYADE
jgi:hypothetical protein